MADGSNTSDDGNKIVQQILQQLKQPEAAPSSVDDKLKGMQLIKAASARKKWMEYIACGKVIEGTRFICFKVPLDKALPTNPDFGKFTTEQLIKDYIPSRGRTLGMVVDLTDTFKFYNPYDAFEHQQIKHIKIFCQGLKDVASEKKTKLFDDAVTRFTKETEGKVDENNEVVLIGVHCMNGVDRTAYFVCQYMVRQMNRQPIDAINAFEEARGCKIDSDEVRAAINAMTPGKAQAFKKESTAKGNKGNSKKKPKKK